MSQNLWNHWEPVVDGNKSQVSCCSEFEFSNLFLTCISINFILIMKEVLTENQIDGRMLMNADVQDLMELGIKKLPAKSILSSLSMF